MCKKKYHKYIKWMVGNCDDFIEHGKTSIVWSYAYYDNLNLFQMLMVNNIQNYVINHKI